MVCSKVDPKTGEKCDNPVTARGLCLKHYQAQRRFKLGRGHNPDLPKEEKGPMIQVPTKVPEEVFDAIMERAILNDSSSSFVAREVLTVWAKKKAAGELGEDWP